VTISFAAGATLPAGWSINRLKGTQVADGIQGYQHSTQHAAEYYGAKVQINPPAGVLIRAAVARANINALYEYAHFGSTSYFMKFYQDSLEVGKVGITKNWNGMARELWYRDFDTRCSAVPPLASDRITLEAAWQREDPSQYTVKLLDITFYLAQAATPTPTNTRSLTPSRTPSKTPTTIGCIGGSGRNGRCIILSPTAIPSNTATPTRTPTPQPIPTYTPLLGEYGIKIVNSQNLSWTAGELYQIYESVKNIAWAFRQTTNGFPPDDQSIFRKVYGINLSDEATWITLSRVPADPQGRRGFCRADNDFKTIYCYGNVDNNNLTEYTIVHEMGHLFDNQAGKISQVDGFDKESLTERMDSGIVIFDCDFTQGTEGERVMGETASGGIASWTRGERGWGSGPAKRQATGDSPLITQFQQNPLLSDFQNTVGSLNYEPDIQLAKNNRVFEAAADMFLNWVYRRRGGIPDANPCDDPVPGDWRGFRNTDWRDDPDTVGVFENVSTSATEGSEEEFRSGSKRYEWMYDEMNLIFDEQGW
jgi:hypothetical protein